MTGLRPQIPEFSDLVQRFAARFPATEAAAVQFAQALTDELGAAEVSCFQVDQSAADLAAHRGVRGCAW